MSTLGNNVMQILVIAASIVGMQSTAVADYYQCGAAIMPFTLPSGAYNRNMVIVNGIWQEASVVYPHAWEGPMLERHWNTQCTNLEVNGACCVRKSGSYGKVRSSVISIHCIRYCGGISRTLAS